MPYALAILWRDRLPSWVLVVALGLVPVSGAGADERPKPPEPPGRPPEGFFPGPMMPPLLPPHCQ
jgi:hypothetical protein